MAKIPIFAELWATWLLERSVQPKPDMTFPIWKCVASYCNPWQTSARQMKEANGKRSNDILAVKLLMWCISNALSENFELFFAIPALCFWQLDQKGQACEKYLCIFYHGDPRYKWVDDFLLLNIPVSICFLRELGPLVLKNPAPLLYVIDVKSRGSDWYESPKLFRLRAYEASDPGELLALLGFISCHINFPELVQ